MFFMFIFQPLGTWWATQTIFVTRHLLKLLLYYFFCPFLIFIHIHWGVLLCIYACIYSTYHITDMYVCVYFPHCIILFNLIHFLVWTLNTLIYLLLLCSFHSYFFHSIFLCLLFYFLYCVFGTINNAIQLLVLFSFFILTLFNSSPIWYNIVWVFWLGLIEDI